MNTFVSDPCKHYTSVTSSPSTSKMTEGSEPRFHLFDIPRPIEKKINKGKPNLLISFRTAIN